MTEKNINYTVSTMPKDRNKDAAGTIEWQPKSGTIPTFIEDISHGFAFCANFFNVGETFKAGRTRDNFKNTYFICFDFDAVRLTAKEFYDAMSVSEIPPTVVYTSANDGTFKPNKEEKYCNRYRVIYAVDEPISSAEYYTELHTSLKAEICEIIKDDSIYNDKTDNGQAERFYYGNANGVYYYDKGNEVVTPLKWLGERYGISFEYNDISFYDEKASAYLSSMTEEVSHGYIDNTTDIIYPLDTFLHDYNEKKQTVPKLFHQYIGLIPTLPDHAQVTITDPTALSYDVPSDYLEIRHWGEFRETMDKHGRKVYKWMPYKWKNGQGRRHKLFIHLMLSRMITPTATLAELLWSAVVFVYLYIDNSDKKDFITKHQIKTITENVFNSDMGCFQVMRDNFKRPKYKVNKEVAREQGISPRQAALIARNERMMAKKAERDKEILKYYDVRKLDKENLQALREKGIDISMSTLKRWKTANGFTKPKKGKGKL